MMDKMLGPNGVRYRGVPLYFESCDISLQNAHFVAQLSVFLICICMTLFNSYQVVLITPSDWLVDNPLMKAEWRSVSMECGGQCVTQVGITMMPKLCADNWVTASAQVTLSCE